MIKVVKLITAIVEDYKKSMEMYGEKRANCFR